MKGILSILEKEVCKLQSRLIWYRGSLDQFINSEPIKHYAIELAKHYFPRRSDNEIYIAPVAHAFAVDLCVAPVIHRTHHLWRYDFDSLDILSQFYRFSTPSKGYYHVAYGILDKITVKDVEYGCNHLGIELGDHIKVLFDTYQVDGARAKVAARTIEALGGLRFDIDRNDDYGFLEREAFKQIRKMKGKGRFRYLRRGRQWMALGTAESRETLNIKLFPATVFDYRVEMQNLKVKITLLKTTIEEFKGKILGVLEGETSIIWKVREINRIYEHFYKEHHFINGFSWTGLDTWVKNAVSKAAKTSEVKQEWSTYQAGYQKDGPTNQPRRGNFFWNVSTLKCDYRLLWSPYKWLSPGV